MWPEALRKSDVSRAARVLPFNAITLSPEANWRQKSAFSMEKKKIHLAESSHRLVWYKKSWLIISEMNVITLILQYIQTHTPSLIYAQSAMENLCHFLLSKQYTWACHFASSSAAPTSKVMTWASLPANILQHKKTNTICNIPSKIFLWHVNLNAVTLN